MRFLADENFPRAAIVALAAGGHDIVWIRNVARGASDVDVLALAARERRILLTFDKDFGLLAGRSELPEECGVVLLRIPVPKSSDVARLLAEQIAGRNDWAGHFSVIEPGRTRMRRLR